MLESRRFRFATLLRVRRLHMDLRAEALADVRRSILRVTQERDDLLDEQRRVLGDAGVRARARFDASDVRRYYQYERYLSQLADAKDAVLSQLRLDEEGRRDELNDSRKRVRIVEQLEDRHNGLMRDLVNKESQKHADEVATNRSAVNRKRRYEP